MSAMRDTPTGSNTDQFRYRVLLQALIASEELFGRFRAVYQAFAPQMAGIEALAPAHGEQAVSYLAGLAADGDRAGWLASLQAIADTVDAIGMPERACFAHGFRSSVVVTRYLKVLSDLEILFGSSPVRVVEVGVGFGGQAAVLATRGMVSHYTLVDLPEVLVVAEKYLSRLGVSALMEFRDATTVEPAALRGDLFISNYALTELPAALQRRYTADIASRFGRGYVTDNSVWSCQHHGGTEALGLLPAALQRSATPYLTAPDHPVSHRGNAIVYWGSGRELPGTGAGSPADWSYPPGLRRARGA